MTTANKITILRIDEGEMKIGLSGVDEGGQPLPTPAPAEPAEPVTASAQEAEAPPAAVQEPAEPAEAVAHAQAVEAAVDVGTEEAAPKKRRTRKKADESPPKS